MEQTVICSKCKQEVHQHDTVLVDDEYLASLEFIAQFLQKPLRIPPEVRRETSRRVRQALDLLAAQPLPSE